MFATYIHVLCTCYVKQTVTSKALPSLVHTLTCTVLCHYRIPIETIYASLTLVSSCVIEAHQAYSSGGVTTSWNAWIDVAVAETV